MANIGGDVARQTGRELRMLLCYWESRNDLLWITGWWFLVGSHLSRDSANMSLGIYLREIYMDFICSRLELDRV